MRINEIKRSNRLWATLSGLNVDIDAEYNSIINLLKLLIALKSPHRVATFSYTIDVFEDELRNLIGFDFSLYPNIPDMKRFKRRCKNMLLNIQRLRTLLP